MRVPVFSFVMHFKCLEVVFNRTEEVTNGEMCLHASKLKFFHQPLRARIFKRYCYFLVKSLVRSMGVLRLQKDSDDDCNDVQDGISERNLL